MWCCLLYKSQPTLRRSLVMVGSKIIDKALSLMTMGELTKATMAWQQAHFGAVMSGLLHLSHVSSDKNRIGEEAKCSSPAGDPMEVWRFCLDDVRGLVHTTQKVTIPPFSMVSIHANSIVKRHCKQVHMLMELMPGPQLLAAVVPKPTYGELHPWSLRVPICLWNMSTHAMEIPAKAVVGQVIPANQGPPVVHPTRTTEEAKPKPPKRWVLDALDLQGLQEWAWVRAEAGQGAASQMGASVYTQRPGSGQNCTDQAQNTTNRWNAFQRVTNAYHHICMMMWGPISRRCLIFVLSLSHAVLGLVQ